MAQEIALHPAREDGRYAYDPTVAESNIRLLNAALKEGGTVTLTRPGSYAVPSLSALKLANLHLGNGVRVTDGTESIAGPGAAASLFNPGGWLDKAIIPGGGWGLGGSPNGAAWQQNQMCEANGFQYVIYWSTNSTSAVPYVAQRDISKDRLSTTWTRVDLTSVLSTNWGNDIHNQLHVFVDSAGYVWVAGMSDANWEMARSNAVNSIAAFGTPFSASAPMVSGAQEDSINYFAFYQYQGKTRLFYRNGVAGDGDWFINELIPGLGTWVRISRPFQGSTDNNSFYPQRVFVDRNGRMHMLGTFRAGVNNENVCYAYSDDGGATFMRSGGGQHVLPITKATMEVAIPVESQAAATGFLNNGGMDVDASGMVHAAWLRATGGAWEVWYARGKAGQAWESFYVTNWGTAIANTRVTRPMVVCTPSGRVYCLLNNFTEYRGLIGIDVTAPESPVIFPFVQMAMYDQDFCIEQEALKAGKLNFLLSPCQNGTAIDVAKELYLANGWYRVALIVASLDLASLDDIRFGRLQPLHLRQVSSAKAGPQTTASTSRVDVTSSAVNVRAFDWALKPYVTRFQAYFRQDTSGAARIEYQEDRVGDTDFHIDLFFTDSPTYNMQVSPLYGRAFDGGAGSNDIRIAATLRAVTSGTANLNDLTVDLFEVAP